MRTKAYNKIVNEHSKGLMNFLCYNLRDQDTAADLVQDTFQRLWEHRKNVDPEKVRGWLYQTARNAMLNYIRKHQRSTVVPEFHDQALSDHGMEHEQFERVQCLQLGLATLNEEQRSMILLRDIEGYGYDEIAEILGIEPKYVKSRLFRARQLLKEAVKHQNQVAKINAS